MPFPMRFCLVSVAVFLSALTLRMKATPLVFWSSRRLKRPTSFKKEAIRTAILAHDKDTNDEFWKRAARARNWDVTVCVVDELKKRLQAEDDESVHFPEKVDKPVKKKLKADDS
eukprot:gene21713-1239_t